ncbi:hypothetical protein L1987_14768 [Smallanthus sonchifolius]|uniref:Uncharacterized protein n=1 Tax=Smallanthus sonchifolius TaxID=185202 RepID=A0ACB9J781_9ASTR|nr:hypothetical protein L1987_14768 [Smallanthus sonchifolius]
MMALHSMGRQHNDPMAVGGGGGGSGAPSSSIAILQERFRQLQKMRERREEMELLKLVSGSETMSQTRYSNRPRNLLMHPEMIHHEPTMTTGSSFQDSLSLGLDLYGKRTEHQPSKTPPFRDLLSMDSVTVRTSRTRDKHDVDTTLHL